MGSIGYQHLIIISTRFQVSELYRCIHICNIVCFCIRRCRISGYQRIVCIKHPNGNLGNIRFCRSDSPTNGYSFSNHNIWNRRIVGDFNAVVGCCAAGRYGKLLIDNRIIRMRTIGNGNLIGISTYRQFAEIHKVIQFLDIEHGCSWVSIFSGYHLMIAVINANGNGCDIGWSRTNDSADGNRCAHGNIGNLAAIFNRNCIFCRLNLYSRVTGYDKTLIDYDVILIGCIAGSNTILIRASLQVLKRQSIIQVLQIIFYLIRRECFSNDLFSSSIVNAHC